MISSADGTPVAGSGASGAMSARRMFEVLRVLLETLGGAWAKLGQLLTGFGQNPRIPRLTAAVIRSTDNGDTWSRPIVIDRMVSDGVRDPADGHAVRTGDLILQIAVDDRTGNLYVVWQEDRFTGEEQIARTAIRVSHPLLRRTPIGR